VAGDSVAIRTIDAQKALGLDHRGSRQMGRSHPGTALEWNPSVVIEIDKDHSLQSEEEH
jgi:hypothetical protein